MKKITFTLLFLLTYSFTFSQVTNGTFDTNIDGWVSQNNATISYEATDGATANGSIKFIATSNNNSGVKTSPNITVSEAGNYILKFKIKGTAGTQVKGDIFQGSFSGGTTYTIQQNDVWEEYTTTFNNLTTDPFNIRILGRTPNATYLADDVEILKTTTQNTYISNGDFETGTLDDWSASGADVSLSSGTGNSSTTAAVLTFDQDITGNNFLDNTEYDFGETVSPSEISIDFDVNTNNTNIEIQVVFKTFDAAGATLETAVTGVKKASTANAWETLSFNKPITTPFNKLQVRLKIKDSSPAATGNTIAFDNVTSEFSYVVLNTETNKILKNVSVYPNPSNGFIYIKSNTNLTSLQIFNLIGKKVLETNFVNNRINLSNLKKGIYLLKLSDENNKTKTQKLIIN